MKQGHEKGERAEPWGLEDRVSPGQQSSLGEGAAEQRNQPRPRDDNGSSGKAIVLGPSLSFLTCGSLSI